MGVHDQQMDDQKEGDQEDYDHPPTHNLAEYGHALKGTHPNGISLRGTRRLPDAESLASLT